jgi:AraC family transcriptional regulator
MINYIEENLENEIEYSKLANIMCVNEDTMQRLFSILCDCSISTYIRNRRLSQAGADLENENISVIDVAIKYQYGNATTFSRAFEKFHGIKPSEVKNNKLKVYPKLVFNENLNSNENFEYKIIQMEELNLYGIKIKTTFEKIKQDAPAFFAEMEKKYCNKYGEIPYGMVSYENRYESHNCEYGIMYNKEILEEPFKKVTIPASKWLVFKINSQDSKEIQKLSNKFYGDFINSVNYSLSTFPELEYYHDGITEFLVPIN